MSALWVPLIVYERVNFHGNNLAGPIEILVLEKSQEPSGFLGLGVHGCKKEGKTICGIGSTWSLDEKGEGSDETSHVTCNTAELRIYYHGINNQKTPSQKIVWVVITHK